MNKVMYAIIAILLGIGIWQYMQLESYKQAKYEARIEKNNMLAASDSLRQIDSTRYAHLTFQYFDLDSVAQSFAKSLQRKNYEITSLTTLNAELNAFNASLQNIVANFDSTTKAYLFKVDSSGMYIVGKVRIVKEGEQAIVSIDTLKVPLEIDIAFVKYTDDGSIEVQIDTKNKNLEIKGLKSYVKVPEKPFDKPKTFQPFVGALIGNQWGIFGGVKYKSIYILGTMQNEGWSAGVGYGF